MSRANLERFCTIVLQTSALQHKLWEAPGLDAFLGLAERLGGEQGCDFTSEDVKAQLYVSRREWRERSALATIPASLDRWFPVRLGRRGPQTVVEWCYMGEQRFVEPFFEQTVSICMRHPFNMLFRLQTSIETLTELQATQPGVPPSGFIFHMSRCGSTLVAQLLATMPRAIVIAEAEPIDAVLRAHMRDPAISDEQRQAWLRAVISALGRKRDPQEQHLFIKFDSWSTMELALIQRTFPGVPWVFLYRDPLEVMVSHQKMRGSQMVPGMLEPALLGLTADQVTQMSLDEYCAHTLGSICAAAAQAPAGAGHFVSYPELPEIVWSALLDFFGVAFSAGDVDRMRHAAQFDAKRRSTPFVSDISAKQQAASDHLRSLADQWAQPEYQRLVRLQQEQEAHKPGR